MNQKHSQNRDIDGIQCSLSSINRMNAKIVYKRLKRAHIIFTTSECSSRNHVK